MSAYIYLEGGASGSNSKDLSIRCQQAFHKLLDRMGFKGRKPRLVACGGRGAVYERFCVEHAGHKAGYVAMWIDSEEPMRDIERPWQHLREVTTVARWETPEGAEDEQVLLMTACMETWIAADRETLRHHYGSCLNESALPPVHDLEGRSRADILERLERATRACRNTYAKGEGSFTVLAALDPAVLQEHLPSFARARRILGKKLARDH